MFQPTHGNSPERQLIYGGEGVGKTSLYLDIAKMYAKTKTPHTVYVLDTDFGVPKMLDEEYQQYVDSGHLVVFNPYTFDELREVALAMARKSGPGDWNAIDMGNHLWEQVQNEYMKQVYGDDPIDYYLRVRQEIEETKARKKEKGERGGDAREYGGFNGADWGYINKIYKDLEIPLTVKTRAHVMTVCEQKQLQVGRGASKQDVQMYKHVGNMKPAGQKGLGHRHDTIFRMTMRANGQRQLTMVKDRGRQTDRWDESRVLNIDAPPKAYAKRYLIEIAGWERTAEGGEPDPWSDGTIGAGMMADSKPEPAPTKKRKKSRKPAGAAG